MKYDLYEALKQEGYTKRESNYGDIIEKEYKALFQPIKVVAVFSTDHSVVTMKYYAGGCKREFKNKVHLNEKRAYNAIMATLYNNGVREVRK